MRDEGAINHIPKLFIVLQFLVHHRIQHGTAFAHGKTSKLGEDVGHGHIVFLANPFYVFHNLLDHVFVIELECERSFDREAPSNVDGIQCIADFFHLAILENKPAQFAPIIGGVFYSRVDKKVQHLERCFATRLNFFFEQGHNVAVADAEARSVKFKLRFFIRGHTNAYLIRAVYIFFVGINFAQVIEYGHTVEPIVEQVGNVFFVHRHFKTIAQNVGLFRNFSTLVQGAHDGNIKSRRSFDVDVVFQCFLQHKIVVRRFGAIAIGVFPIVFKTLHGIVKGGLCKPDVFAYAWQVGDL